MSLKLERLLAKQQKEIDQLKKTCVALQNNFVSQTQLIQDLLNKASGLEAVFTNKIKEMIDENLEIEIEYGMTQKVLEGLGKGGISHE